MKCEIDTLTTDVRFDLMFGSITVRRQDGEIVALVQDFSQTEPTHNPRYAPCRRNMNVVIR